MSNALTRLNDHISNIVLHVELLGSCRGLGCDQAYRLTETNLREDKRSMKASTEETNSKNSYNVRNLINKLVKHLN